MSARCGQPDAIRIRGLGLITPLGEDLETSWRRIVDGAAIDDHARAPIASTPGVDRVTALGATVAREAIAAAGWSPSRHDGDRTALVVGTSKGPVDDWIETWQGRLASADQPDARTRQPAHDVAAPPSTSDKPLDPFSQLRSEIGLHTVAAGIRREINPGIGPVLTISCACATGIAALIRGILMLRDGSADRVVVVATESSLHPLFLGSFRRLGVLTAPGEPVRPLDQRRSGFLISEAAAAMCLERGHPQPGDILIDRFAMGADATHLTGIDPQGQTIRSCLKQVQTDQPIDLVHAHATGTQLNDPIELAAIDDLAAATASRLIVYSHKAAIGHSLGAAGLISVVLNCMMHREGIVPGNINTHLPLTSRQATINRAVVRQPIRRSIAMAAGFGGAAAAISLVSA